MEIPIEVSLKFENSSINKQTFPLGSAGLSPLRFFLIQLRRVVLYNAGMDVVLAIPMALNKPDISLFLIKKL